MSIRKYYFTFGSSEQFPYQNGYLIVRANNLREAIELFKGKHPNIHDGMLNCSDYYTETQWNKYDHTYGDPFEIIKKEDRVMTIKEYANEVATKVAGIINNVTTEVKDVEKNNGVMYTGITIMPNGKNVAPTFYVNDAFNNGIDIDVCASEIAKQFNELDMKSSDVSELIDSISDFEKIKDKIVMCLSNGKLNQSSEVAKVPFLDLIIVFKILVDLKQGAFVTINQNMLTVWNKNVYDLLEIAKVNTPKILPYEHKTLVHKLCKTMGITKEDAVSMGLVDIPGMPHFLSNTIGTFGSAVILYDGLLKEISNGKDLLIVPSSIHEVLFNYIEDGLDPEYISNMIKEVNTMHIEPEEVLSDHPYKYIAKLDKIELL